VLNRHDVEALLDIRTAIALVDDAMRALSRGELGDMPGEKRGSWVEF
jgi:hypothetical protein